MKRAAFLLIFLILAAAAGAAWFLSRGTEMTPGAGAPPVVIEPAAVGSFAVTRTPGVETTYLNTALGFSFALPDGLTTQERTAGGEAVVAAYDAAGVLRLMVRAAPADGAVTPASVREAMQGAEVKDAAEAQVAGDSGVVFESSDISWSGATRELWFAHAGHRYRATVRGADAALLELVRGSWQWHEGAP
jgi:hypothetical protein